MSTTAAGGTQHSVFVVRAFTDTIGVYFDAPPDSGYSVDNLVPHVPPGFMVEYGPAANTLAWEAPGDEDVVCYRIYRSTDPDFVPGAGDLVGETAETGWIDEVSGGPQYFYRITAVDDAGNESPPGAPEEVTGAPDLEAPNRFALYPCTPNPAAPSMNAPNVQATMIAWMRRSGEMF